MARYQGEAWWNYETLLNAYKSQFHGMTWSQIVFFKDMWRTFQLTELLAESTHLMLKFLYQIELCYCQVITFIS